MSFIDLSQLENLWVKIFPIGRTIVTFSVLFFVAHILIKMLQTRLLKRVRTRKQTAAVIILTKSLRYIILGILIFVAFSTVSDSLVQIGFTVSLLSAAIGFALQKPITGIAAWVMLIIKRPFEIGDRVTIGLVKGNVKEITLTHVFLEEVGRYGGEEISGRTIIIANAKLFDENIINYTFANEYILGQIIFTITFESNLDEAVALALKIVKEHTDEYTQIVHKKANVRLYFTANGMEIHPRYYVPVSKAQEIASKITRDIFTEIKNHPDIELSYQQYKVQSGISKKGRVF